MSLLGIAGVVLFLLLLFLGMPVALSMGVAGFVGTFLLKGIGVALPQLHIKFYHVAANYSFSVLPLFILMGYFAGVSGISSDLYRAAERWLRRLPGGLALATIAGCAAFSGICGSSMATAATMGTVALPEMRQRNYDGSLAAGTIAAGGTLGFLIPPSIAFVVYGIIAEESIGKLLIAGILPGIILAILFMLVVIVKVKLNPRLAPVIPEPVSWKERIASFKDVWGVLLIFLLVMGGILLGFFTPTEAGGAGAFILFIFALAKRKINFRVLYDTLLGASMTTCMIFVILYGAYIFTDFLTLSRVPMELVNSLGGLDVSPYVIFTFVVIIYLILGCFIDPVPMLIITVPVLLPLLKSLGFDPVWFGVIAVILIEAGLITPPVGLNVFVIAGMAKDVPMTAVFRGALPFLSAMIVMVILLVLFPAIALVLPGFIR